MKLLTCLCLVICFKDVFLQTNCYRCPASSSLTNKHFHAHNCSFLQNRRSYICCVPTTASFSCKPRRKRSNNPNFSYFIQSNPPPIMNPLVNSLGIGQQNSFLPNPLEHQFHQSQIYKQANNVFNPNSGNHFLNNIPHPPTYVPPTYVPPTYVQPTSPHFQQNRPFFQLPGTNNFFAQSGGFAPPFHLNQPYQPSNTFFNQPNNNNYFKNLAQPNEFLHQINKPKNVFDHAQSNISSFIPNSPSFHLSFLTTASPTTKVDAAESFHSEYHYIVTVTPPEVNIKEIPIKRSLHKSEEMPLSDIHKHKNFDLLPLNETCGWQEYGDRIFGGEDAFIGEFPWMSLLEYGFNGRSIGFKCGGVLINDRYVLTAAHCITGRTIIPQEILFSVRLGEHDLNRRKDCDENNNCNDLLVNIEVEEVVLHHYYHEMDRNIHNDIALVRLNQKVLFTDFVRPICLPLQGERRNPGKDMAIVGWGLRNEETPSQVKQTASIPYINDTECKEIWKDVVEIIDSQFCAGGNSRVNVCRGDSGGPIMSSFPENGQWYVEGIVSFGKVPCGGEPFPSVYTRVSSYITWILDNIKE